MDKPRTYKQKANRSARMCKTHTAREAIGTIEHNSDTYIMTFGQFSLIDAMITVLDQTGPATVDVGTWIARVSHLERSVDLLEQAKITRFRLIIDQSFETIKPDYCRSMRRLFGQDCIRSIRTHCKFMVIRSATHNVAIRTSMNLNENPRLENIEVSEGSGLCDFLTEIVDEIFRVVPPGYSQRHQPDIVTGDNPFPPIQATLLDRDLYKEPTYTHTIKT